MQAPLLVIQIQPSTAKSEGSHCFPPGVQFLKTFHSPDSRYSTRKRRPSKYTPTVKRDLKATLYLFRRDELFMTLKPYSLFIDTKDELRSNLESYKVPGLLIMDIRAHDGEYTFNKNGIAVVEYNSKMEYENWFDQKKIEDIYCQDLGQTLIKQLGCSAVQIFETLVSFTIFCQL